MSESGPLLPGAREPMAVEDIIAFGAIGYDDEDEQGMVIEGAWPVGDPRREKKGRGASNERTGSEVVVDYTRCLICIGAPSPCLSLVWLPGRPAERHEGSTDLFLGEGGGGGSCAVSPIAFELPPAELGDCL